MTSFFAPARTGVFLGAALALAAACSSNVSGPTTVNDPDRVTILPDTAVLYSGLPTTFTVSGGTGTYSITSSNQAVVQVPTFLNGRTFEVTPANVLADTTVTISVRDSAAAPIATAALTVRPGTVANTISVIPTANQGGDCAPAVCSGGDAVVVATLTQGGSPLPARGVRLDVVSGDFRFITSAPGQSEVLATSVTVVTDQAGNLVQRLRALPGAANQTAVVQVTDLGTSAFRRATFNIAQATGPSPGFFTVPDTISFTGPNNQTCAVGLRADVSIFGGSPPYTIGNGGGAFGISQTVVTASGGSFYVVANGTCANNVPIVVSDSAGRTSIVTVSNVLGTLTVPDLVLSPSIVTLADCTSQATVTVAGGIPNSFTVSNQSGAVFTSVDPSRRTIGIQRSPNQAASTPVLIGVASGDKVATITVNLTGVALNTRCDGAVLRVTPTTATISSCSPVSLVVFGGSGTYAASSNNSALSASISSNILTIQRFTPSAATTTSAVDVVVTDTAGGSVTVPVTITASGQGACI